MDLWSDEKTMASLVDKKTNGANAIEKLARHPLRPMIEKMAAHLAQEPGVEQIILYGSQATGEAHADSDIDLFIVNQAVERAKVKCSVWEDEARYFALQSLIYSPEHVRQRLERGDQFIQQILERGIELYRDADYQCDKEWLALAKQRKDSLYPLDWLRVAEKDWKRASQRLTEGDVEDAAFRLQQALEKYLKAFLLAHGWELQKTHETTKLLLEASAHEPELAKYIELCRRVEAYYLEERYPAETHELALTHENVARAVNEAQALRELLVKGLASLPKDESQAS